MSKFLKKSQEKGIIHILSTRNNTILTLTDLEGNSKFWSSAGNIGFKNSRKSTSYAAQAVAELVATKALNPDIPDCVCDPDTTWKLVGNPNANIKVYGCQ